MGKKKKILMGICAAILIALNVLILMHRGNVGGSYELHMEVKADKAQNIQVYYSPTQALTEKLKALNPDLIVLAGFLVAIPASLIEAFPNRIINIHPSLIPSFCGVGYYGLKVHEAALARGVKLTGATVHLVDEGMDSGPILLQKAVEVKPGDTPELLQRRVMEEAEWVILPRAIDMIANGQI